jgi:type II secretory ATPase GspE/PulE/Tfp pilus assembly ATPase PilB-like protein
MAQRLARKICPHCKVEYNIKEENLQLWQNAMEAI